MLRHAHAGFCSDLPFFDAVEMILIVTAIFIAENNGEPFTGFRLSKHLGVPRPTLQRKLAALIKRGVIVRDENGRLRVIKDTFATAVREKNIRDVRDKIIQAGRQLSRY